MKIKQCISVLLVLMLSGFVLSSCSQEMKVEEPLVDVVVSAETEMQKIQQQNTKTILPTSIKVDYYRISLTAVGNSNPVPDPIITQDGNCIFSIKQGDYIISADGYIKKGAEMDPATDLKVVHGAIEKNITISDTNIHIIAEAVSNGTGSMIAKFTWTPAVVQKEGPLKKSIDAGKLTVKVNDKDGREIKSVDFTSFDNGLEVRVDDIPSGRNKFYSFALYDDKGNLFYQTAPIATHIYPGQVSVADTGDSLAFNFTETFYPRYARNILLLKSVEAKGETVKLTFNTGGQYEGIIFHLEEVGTGVKTVQTPECVQSGQDKVYTLNVDSAKCYNITYQVNYKGGYITSLVTDSKLTNMQTNLDVPGVSVAAPLKDVTLKLNQQNGGNTVFSITSTPKGGAKDIVPENTEWLLGNPDDNPMKYKGATFTVNSQTWYNSRKKASILDTIDEASRTITSPLVVTAEDENGNGYTLNALVTIQAPFEYKVKEYEDHVVLTEYLGTDTVVTVPDEYHGKPVTRLEGTFHGKRNSGITDIILPSSVTYIGPNFKFKSFCFDENDANPENMIIPPGEEMRWFLGDGGSSLSSLKSINLEHVKELGPGALLILSKTLTSIDLSSVEKIGYNAVYGYIEEIKGLQNLKEIEYFGMTFIQNLKKITLPTGLVKVGKEAFYGWTASQTIDISRVADMSQWDPDWNAYCNAKIIWPPVPVSDFTVKDYGDHVALTGYKGKATVVIVPAEANGKPVTRLEGTFEKNNTITEIVLPPSVTYIGSNFTLGANGDTEFFPQETVAKSFLSGGDSTRYPLKSINLENVTEIGYGALMNTAVTSLNLSKVQKIGAYAFGVCDLLTDIGSLDSLVEVQDAAFTGTSSLRQVTIPSCTTKMSMGVFSTWTNDQTIDISNVSDMSQWNPDWNIDCNAKIIWPETKVSDFVVKDYGNYVALVEYKGKIQKVVVPAEANGKPVTRLEGTFHDNSIITEIVLPPSVTYIGPSKPNPTENDRKFLETGRGLSPLKTINLENVKEIGQQALFALSKLESVDLSNVEILGYGALGFNGGLKEVKNLNKVKEIGGYAFSSDTLISTITLPACLTKVGEEAFCSWESSQTINMASGINKANWDPGWNTTCKAKIVNL